MAIRFDGDVVLVTGAGRGIGRADAECLAARGARVVVNNRSHGEPDPTQRSADLVVAAIRAAGGEAVANHEDVAKPGACARMVEHACSVWGRLDGIVCNAGVAPTGMFHKLGLEQIHQTVSANILGTLELVHAALPVMRSAGHGRIVVTTSSTALGDVGYAAYAASKTAMHGFVRSLALENRSKGVLVNALLPFAHTRMSDRHFESGFFPEEASEHVTPAHVAELAVLLLSRECPVSGEIVAVGGGIFRRLELLQSRGLELHPATASAELVLEHYATVADMSEPLRYDRGGEMLLDLAKSNLRRAARPKSETETDRSEAD